jgi:hypothetical protein
VTVAFQPDSGRLRLSAEEFELMVVSLSEQAGAESGPAAALHEAGVLRADGPHPALRLGLSTVVEPVCRLDVCVAGGAARLLHQGWFSTQAAAFLRHVREDEFEFLTVPPEFVPVALARMVRLGPRQAGADREGSEISTACFDDLFSAEATRRTAALRLLGGVADRRVWRLDLVWPGPEDSLAGRAVAATDGPDGMCLLEPTDESRVVLRPLSATTAWQRFVTMLPTDHELGETHAAPDDAQRR